ncbi:MAG: caspase family protein [Alphaproteobacteria bacterium]|nr:caspase family protein [Alphaproteobacteria bacterium]
MGRIYETGGPVKQDSMTAIEWYRKAAAQGVKKAADKLKLLLAIHGPISPKAAAAPAIQPKKFVVTSVAKPDDIAVVIGNGNYQNFGKDIPDVAPAHADAGAFKKWLIEAKGLRDGNIIFLKDATSAQIESVFGNERSHKGQLFNWTKANSSNVYVYYAGHGAPASDGGSAYLVPADATASSIELTGYPLATLYANLKKIPAKSITLVLESCFSGASQGGYVINRTSGILVTPKIPSAPKNITIISAGKADQVASWEQDDSHSLFTKYFLLGMGGAADKSPHGNGDGKVAYAELGKYLDDTLTYYARRYYGRDQNAQIVTTTR